MGYFGVRKRPEAMVGCRCGLMEQSSGQAAVISIAGRDTNSHPEIRWVLSIATIKVKATRLFAF